MNTSRNAAAVSFTTPVSTRIIASLIAVGVTAGIFSAAISPAMQQQADGSVQLAHSAVKMPNIAPEIRIAHVQVVGEY